MLIEDEVLFHLEMHFPSGVLLYLDIKVKEVKTYKHFFITLHFMSQSIPTGCIPPGNPWGLAQKTCPGGQDLAFESCPGGGNSRSFGILWKMKLKHSQKNSVDQIFTGENKKKTSRIFYLFRSLRVFSIEFFLVYGSIFWFYCHTYLTKNLKSFPWLVYLKFPLGYGYPHPLFA